jgi:argininosuccinate synthase
VTRRIVLAQPAGSLTSAAARRVAAETGAEVVVVAVGLGGPVVPDSAVRTVDAVTEFADDHCLPAVQANALVTEPAWPLVVRHAARAARRHGVTTVAHCHRGAARRRFEAGLAAVAPDLGVLAVPGDDAAECTLWSYPVGPGDHWRFPADGEFVAPDEVVVTFDRGIPVAVDGETVSVAEACRLLGRRAEAQGVGRRDAVAMPGALALVTAHRALERVTCEPELARLKRQVDRKWAALVRDGHWFSPVKHALDGFVVEAQEAVSGEVRLLLHDGRVTADGDGAEGEPDTADDARPGRIVTRA